MNLSDYCNDSLSRTTFVVQVEKLPNGGGFQATIVRGGTSELRPIPGANTLAEALTIADTYMLTQWKTVRATHWWGRLYNGVARILEASFIDPDT